MPDTAEMPTSAQDGSRRGTDASRQPHLLDEREDRATLETVPGFASREDVARVRRIVQLACSRS
ncbi:MAG TPA: hypothetical protein VFT47_08760 [Vicinamibacterales bacterium]|nr:hypothetical protein [Vicinamibacterales bacterium]